MQYLGGKTKLAKRIAAVINGSRPDGAWVWEPFCGGASVTAELAQGGHVLATDIHGGLINMWRAAVDDGWCPNPFEIDDEIYAKYKENPDPSDPMTALLGFGCSYGGKYFRGYIGAFFDGKNWGHYPLWAVNSVLRKSRRMRDKVLFQHRDFLNPAYTWPRGWPIYCDPPYEGTQGYKGVPAFHHERFWKRAEWYALQGCPVFVSEFREPPPTLTCGVSLAWSLQRKRNIGARVDKEEKLFLLEI